MCTLDTIHVKKRHKKRHNKALRHIIEMLSMVIKAGTRLSYTGGMEG